ncbi:MAG: serine/threonine-protein kinase PknK [Pyrinomonadaceae bacterium]
MSSSDAQRVFLHYRIVEKIGSGGMGEVFKAEDTKLGRTVALKVLPATANDDATAKRRFLKEAQAASALNHPNIVTIHAIEEAGGVDFIVMEFIEGQTLKAMIEHGGALPLANLLEIGIQVADALGAAHEIGLVHRDVKAANIIVSERGRAKVLDFGLAKIVRTIAGGVDGEALTLMNLTGEGTVLGTAFYMSPEQTRGETLDARSDIFSLGCVLYEAATRSLPFNGPSILSVMHAIATTDPRPPSLVRPGLPRQFDLIVERSLAKDKERRYASVEEMGEALRNLRASLTGQWAGAPIIYDKDLIQSAANAFVGRDAELKKLEEIVEQAVAGAGRVVFITGEPGIGKTSLSDEFLRRARSRYPGVLVSRGRCVEQYGTGEAYLPFLDAVGALLDGPGSERLASVMRTYAPTWCTQLPAAFASTGAVERLQQETIGATKDRMMREMGDALSNFATITPVVLLLEDLHWADPSSVDLLRHLSQRITNQRLLIAGTFRPEDIERTNHPLKSYKAEMQSHRLCEEVALSSLARDHIADYLNATFTPNDFPRELATLIHDKTEGHPLFAINLLQYLSEHGDIDRTNAHWSLMRPLAELDLEAPESVRSMISKKIDGLGAEQRRTLQYASVEGTEFLSTVVAALLDVDEVDLEEQLADLQKTHRLIEVRGEEDLPDGSLATRYRFSHALYQNFLYADLVAKRRVMLHRQAGEQLLKLYGHRAPQLATQLALHFERGRNFPRAIEYLIQAGDNATTLYANAEAAEHYTRALSLVDRLSEAERTDPFVTLYQKRGAVNFALSRFSESVDDYTSLLKYQESLGSPEKQTVALNALSLTLFFSHRLEELELRANEAVAAAKRAGSEELRLQTLALMSLKHLCYGELDLARPIQTELIETSRSLNQKGPLASGLIWRGALYFFQTDYRHAIDLEIEGRQLASELRDGFLLLCSLFFLGLSKANLGQMSEALALLDEAIRMARRNGDMFWQPRIPNCIGWIHRELQDFAGAFKFDQEGVEVGHQHHVLEAEANSLINLGIDHTHAGNIEATSAAFHQVRDIFQRDAWFRWRYNIRLQAAMAEHCLRQGETVKARETAHALLETAVKYEVHKYIAVAHNLMAEIAIAEGDTAAAETEFRAALDEFEQHPVPVIEWKIYANVGRLRSTQGDSAGAREAFGHAATIVNKIAASVTDETLRKTFLESAAVAEIVDNGGG